MSSALMERGLWVATAIVAAAAMLASRPERPSMPAGVPAISAAPAVPRSLDADSIASAIEYAVAHDPFRLSRQPATVAYSPALEGLAPAVTRGSRPAFVLRGIVGGPPWSAVIDGVPGHDGSTLLRKGDSVATFVVRAVGRDTVIIQGADTTWQLTVKRTW